jgi:hypothetical protein
VCNGGAHREVECWLFNHPDGNHENKPFEYSSKGALWKAKGYDRLPHNLKLDDSAWEDAQQFAQRPSFYRGGRGPTPYRGGRFNGRGRGGRFGGRSNQSEFTNDSRKNNKRNRENEVELLNSINENNDNNFLVDVNIFPQEVGEGEEDTNSIRIGTLFDSGAVNNNYISAEVAQELEMRGTSCCCCCCCRCRCRRRRYCYRYRHIIIFMILL